MKFNQIWIPAFAGMTMASEKLLSPHLGRFMPAHDVNKANSIRTLALHGLTCPHTFVRAKLAMETLAAGEQLKVIVDNALSKVDLPRSAQLHGYTVLDVEETEPGVWAITLQK